MASRRRRPHWTRPARNARRASSGVTPARGNGDCRVVAVGAVPAVIGGNYIYNGSGQASPTGTGGWYDNWNKYVAPNTYKYAGTQNYHTSDGFSDDPSNSVDAIMRRNVEASSKPSIVVIVLDKYQPAPPSYHLSISTQAAEMSGQAGDTATLRHDHPVQRRVEDRERERHRDPALTWH